MFFRKGAENARNATTDAAMIQQQAERAINNFRTQHDLIYFTNGSLDPVSGRSGAAFVFNEEQRMWRTPDNCSTLQTELAAIAQARKHAERGLGHILINTDSQSAISAIQRTNLNTMSLSSLTYGQSCTSSLNKTEELPFTGSPAMSTSGATRKQTRQKRHRHNLRQLLLT